MLSEEEKKLLIIFKAQVEKEETEYFSVNAYTQLLYDSHKTVLKLITKLQKESELQKENYKNLILDVSRIAIELGLEEDGTIDEIYSKIKEKDKQIDLMAKYIAKEDTTEEFCDYKTVCDHNCEECVVQHFKDKVTEK